MIIYDDYASLFSHALQSEKHAKNWHKWLRLKMNRDQAEKDIIKDVLRKHPGVANYEILEKYSEYLNSNFPVPGFPYIIKGVTP